MAVVPGGAFGPSGEGHVRTCYATSDEQTRGGARPDRPVRLAAARTMTDAMRLIGGRPVAIHEMGEGIPILFLHGFGIDHRSLLVSVGPVFERRPGYRRLHVDLPGFGASPADPSIDSSDAAADFVLELIDAVIGDAAVPARRPIMGRVPGAGRRRRAA